jgi:asparagine synthetase B (glutamine-hydrolysing)
MSGFLVSRRPDADPTSIQRRGPDLTRSLEIEGYHFTHYLACVTGELMPQLFVDGNVVCVFDGEIYDRPAGSGLGETLIRLYREHGEDFARYLDGDFAVAVYDFDRRILVAATDPFASKPLFVNGTEAASYRSALGGGERVASNTVWVVDLDGGPSRQLIVAPFDFDHQHKESYDDWIVAFERAVRKRATDGCYVPLSAGYDSGGIDCALARLGIPYKAYSIEGNENVDLLRQRNLSGELLTMDEKSFAEWEAFLLRHAETESFRLNIRSDDGRMGVYDVLEDGAANGLAWIHSLALAEGRKVFLSGTGGDDLLDGYRQWPEKLQPWTDFAARWGTAYLAKEEFVAGVFGVEGRYPFFDRAVVQEFLWLSAELKSRFFKAPLHEYMTRCDYPFDEDRKTGFVPLAPVKSNPVKSNLQQSSGGQ